MSSGYATPEVTAVAPDIDFPTYQAPSFEAPGVELPGVHVSPGDAVDTVIDQLADLALPALIGLGSLSGALLAARAAMAGTRLLANAAVRAAEAQQVRADELHRARRTQEQWRDAAFAVSRANARIDALHARIRRDAPDPDGPPPPGLPPALDPVGLRLDQVYAWLTETDRAVRRVEADLAQRTMDTAARGLRAAAPGPRRAAELRARREQALAAYVRAGTEAAAGAALPAYTTPLPEVPALTRTRAADLGAELLAGLDTAASVADCRQVQEAIGHAVELAEERPAAARRHLSEARDLAFAANWRAADRRETTEWAAQQLRFLRQPLPVDTDPPLPSAAPEIAALERILETGEAVDPKQRAEISVRVAARETALQRVYVAQLLRQQIGSQARPAAPGVDHLEWAPPGWGTEHWLRFALDPEGTLRVQTVHRERAPHEDTRAARELDRQRCREAADHLARLAETAAAAGLSLDVVFNETPTAAGTWRGPARTDETGTGTGTDRRTDDRDAPAHRYRTRDERP